MADIERSYRGTEPSGSWAVVREHKQTHRELAQIDGRTTRELARIDAVVEVQQEKLRAMNSVGTTAMMATAQLSQTETALAQMVPHASGRLAAIADLTTVQSAEIVVDTARRIRR